MAGYDPKQPRDKSQKITLMISHMILKMMDGAIFLGVRCLKQPDRK